MQFEVQSWRSPPANFANSISIDNVFSERIIHRLVDNACERQLRTYDSLASTLRFLREHQIPSITRGTTTSQNRAPFDK